MVFLAGVSQDLAAKYAAVASKSMVESSMLSSKQDSIDSMVPEPFSDADTWPVQLAMCGPKKADEGRDFFFSYPGHFYHCCASDTGLVFGLDGGPFRLGTFTGHSIFWELEK